MSEEQEVLLTAEGLKKLEEKLENLKTVRRKEVAARIKQAIDLGDLSENSEYDSAKNEQAELEERIIKLENMIRKAKIIDENEVPKDQVSVGLKVQVEDMASHEEMEFVIVGSTEADPFAGRISNESLVGQHLLGKKIGDVVEIIVPDGLVTYKIKNISKEEK